MFNAERINRIIEHVTYQTVLETNKNTITQYYWTIK